MDAKNAVITTSPEGFQQMAKIVSLKVKKR